MALEKLSIENVISMMRAGARMLPKYMRADDTTPNVLRIQRLSSYGKPQEDFLYSVWHEFKNSAERQNMLIGEAYFNNENEINERVRTSVNEYGILEEDEKLSNAKLSHPFVTKLVKQKVNYLLGNAFSIRSDDDDKEFESTLNDDYFTKQFRKIIKGRCKEAINKGKSWLQVYYNEDGELKFKSIPSEEIKAFWSDNEHTELEAVLRVYTIKQYNENGTVENIVIYEYYTKEGIWKYKEQGTGLVAYEEQDADGNEITNPRAYFTATEKAADGEKENKIELLWGKIPFICFKYNEEELPLIKYIKQLVDDYDTNTSDLSNQLQDIPKNITVIKNYSGQDLAEFVKNVRKYRAVLVDGEGGVSNMTTDDNSASYETHLTRLRKDIFDFANGVDTQSTDLGNASGQAIKFRFLDLDLDMSDMANEFNSAINELLWFIKADIFARTGKDYEDKEINIIFNNDIVVNDSETIENLKNSVGIISKRTLVANHPYVDDVEDEIAQIEKEEQAEQEKFMVQNGNSGFGTGSAEGETAESKSIYKITNITGKYAKGDITKATASRLLSEIGLDEESVNFYLNEADTNNRNRKSN